MTGYIYCYTNKINNKKYIGQTIYSIKARAGKNGKNYNKQFKFGNAILKYGWDNFVCEILEEVNSESREELCNLLNEKERYWISFFDSYNNGYNCDLGGNSKIMSDNTKEKLRVINTGKKSSDETKKKISKSLLGVPRKNKENYGKSRIGTHLSDETKEKISKTKKEKGYRSPNLGKTLSDETKKKISISKIGKKPWNKNLRGRNMEKTNEQLSKLKNITDLISNASGIKEKISIIKENANDDDFVYFLYFLFDPYVTTGLKLKKITKDLPEYTKSYNFIDITFIDLLKKIEKNNTGSSKENFLIRKFIDKHLDFKDFIIKTVTKTLKLGIQAHSVNKAIPNCCRSFDVMLAEKYFDDPEKYLPKGKKFILSTKLDGMRCVCIKEHGHEPQFFSRQGQLIEGLNDLLTEVKKYIYDDIVLDGELLLDNKDNLPSKDLYRATVKVVNCDSQDKKNIIFNVFDELLVDEFRAGECHTCASKRKEYLHNMLKDCDAKYIKEVENLYEGEDQTEITKWLDKITSSGGEGVMINIADAPYECKRTRNLLKVKKMQTMDLRCIGVEEGTGANAGKLGAIVVEFPAPDGNTYNVSVGSGFLLEEREKYWDWPNLIINKIVEVQYFEVSQNQQGGYSLRFPVFKWVREDKDEVSVY